MASRFVGIGRTPLVWLIATSSTLETTGQAIEAALERNPLRVLLWVFIGGLIFMSALIIENLKGRADES